MEISYEKIYLNENSLFHYQEFIQPRFTSPLHYHDEFELIFIKRSHGKLFIGSNVLNFREGDIFFFAPDLPHCFYNSQGYEKKNKPAHAIVIQFKERFLGEDFFYKTECSHLNRLILRSKYGILFMHSRKELQKKILALGNMNDLEKVGELLLILDELSKHEDTILLSNDSAMSFRSLSDSKIIKDVYRYVAENFQDGISFEKAASMANMQPSAFSRYFKRKTKKKFSEFVNETRIMHARKLIAETDKNMNEIAFECGYENISYFNRLFKQQCHMTPMDFKQQFLPGPAVSRHTL